MARTTARTAKKKAAAKAATAVKATTKAAEAVVEEVKDAAVKGVEPKAEKAVEADIKEVAAAAKETVKDTGAKVVDKAKEVTKKVEKTNPTILYKAMKNDVEIENIKKAHVKDGVAHTKFMYWLKTSLGKEKMTEMSASDKLENLRAQQEGFLWPSFEPICAFKANAAMCHYTSSAETDCELTAGNLFLTDTGGNYYEGSTDITRTVALGEINDELKLHFTTVLRSMMNLSRAKFLYGCCGYNLDVLARQPMWELGLDYNHGTGHGVGYLLNIHEGPTGFRWRIRGHEAHPLEAGMVITDEPGIYIEGSHGIRTENELVVRKGEETEYGQFMYFEPITYVPIDLDAINPDLLREDEKAWLNAYHKQVYDIIAPHLTKEEEEWLRIYTREI